MATGAQHAKSTLHIDTVEDLKAFEVSNFAGEDLGHINDLVLDVTTGHVTYVIISAGGFFTFGERLFAMPWELFTVLPDERRMLLNVNKETLLNAPHFDRAHQPDMSDAGWISDVHAYFAQKPYWNSDITDAGDYAGDDRLDKPDRDRV